MRKPSPLISVRNALSEISHEKPGTVSLFASCIEDLVKPDAQISVFHSHELGQMMHDWLDQNLATDGRFNPIALKTEARYIAVWINSLQ